MPRNHHGLALLAVVVGCQGWHHVANPVPNGSIDGNPAMVRVTRTQGCGGTPTPECTARRTTLTLYNPRIEGDSMIAYYDMNQRERVAISTRDVVSVESRGVSAGKTAGLAIGSGLLIGILVATATVIAILSALGQ